jgi:hypothetical protein
MRQRLVLIAPHMLLDLGTATRKEGKKMIKII